MRVLVTGGTGFLGGHLLRALARRGDVVTVLSRSPERVRLPGVSAAHWDPGAGGDWFRAVSGQDAVVHLAGQQAVGVRYTAARERALFESRVRSGELLAEAIESATERPSVFLTASAVGYYGSDTSSERKTESSPAGSDFLAKLCVAWEAPLERVQAAGVRAVAARLGIVLGLDGGALPKMALPFRLGVGGPIGSGEQGVSWVHHADFVRALLFLLDEQKAIGAVNVCAPEPASNAEFSRALAKALRRPSWLAAPSFALRAVFGSEGARPLLGGQYALPERLEALGFGWRFPELGAALEDLYAPSKLAD